MEPGTTRQTSATLVPLSGETATIFPIYNLRTYHRELILDATNFGLALAELVWLVKSCDSRGLQGYTALYVLQHTILNDSKQPFKSIVNEQLLVHQSCT